MITQEHAFTAVTIVAMTSTAVFGGGLFDIQEQAFQFPLTPGTAVLVFDQFDEEDCARRLRMVTLEVEGAMWVSGVTFENLSVLPAPDVALHLDGIMNVDLLDQSVHLGFSTTVVTDGSICATDDVPGSGCDFWDFGTILDAGQEVDHGATGLAPFIGKSTIDASIFAAGGFYFVGSWSMETIEYDEFAAGGTVTLAYTYVVPCPGDVDADEDVGIRDLLFVLAHWGSCSNCPADVDCSGDVGLVDLLAVLEAWGGC